jgi:OmpA-OmpF porin, OOP family
MVNQNRILTFFLLLSVLYGTAQNLVPNPSFEEKAYCPVNFNQQSLRVVNGWKQLNEGTPDYFNGCAEVVGVPKNMFGEQPGHTGVGYMGMAIYSPSKRNYREYMEAKLSRPLTAGEMVCIEMYVSAADYCKYVVDGLGATLSAQTLKQDRYYCVNEKGVMQNPRLHMLDECGEWFLLSDVYTAKGGEEYITIGNFKMDRDMKILSRTKEMGAKENSNWAYVYIDDVSVKPIKKKEECSCENDFLATMVVDPPLELSEYDHIKLDAILFDFDQDVLKPEAIVQLEEVYKLLRKNRSMYLEIDGHADIIGDDGYNVELSKRRADRVISYLTDKGISKERLNEKAFGSAQPTAENSTSEGRAQNRRVEFQILKKRFELVQ